jgi:uncharacterized protein with LGFP repeats
MQLRHLNVLFSAYCALWEDYHVPVDRSDTTVTVKVIVVYNKGVRSRRAAPHLRGQADAAGQPKPQELQCPEGKHMSLASETAPWNVQHQTITDVGAKCRRHMDVHNQVQSLNFHAECVVVWWKSFCLFA